MTGNSRHNKQWSLWSSVKYYFSSVALDSKALFKSLSALYGALYFSFFMNNAVINLKHTGRRTNPPKQFVVKFANMQATFMTMSCWSLLPQETTCLPPMTPTSCRIWKVTPFAISVKHERQECRQSMNHQEVKHKKKLPECESVVAIWRWWASAPFAFSACWLGPM